MESSVADFIYLACIVLFIVGLKKLIHPETARNGNLVAATGMGMASGRSSVRPGIPLDESH